MWKTKVKYYHVFSVFVICCFLIAIIYFGRHWYINYVPQFKLPNSYDVKLGGYIHLSVDDSNSIFADLTENKDVYNSIFDQPSLEFVKNLHDKYGIVISFYCYYSWNIEDDDRFTLSDATDYFANEFTENADWLKFGFHAADADAYSTVDVEIEQEYYEKTIAELIRITGTEKAIDNFIRLDRYIADDEMVKMLYDEGIVGLLTTSHTDGSSYALSDDELSTCFLDDWFVDENGMMYTPTDMNLESIENDEQFYNELMEMASEPRMIVFTHEWILDDKNVKKYMTWIAQFASEYNIPFEYPENEMLYN